MTNLLSPIRIGGLDLKHRVAMAPMTRNRADDHHVPLDIAREYYAQRASVPGTLLINEGTFISARAGGMENVPGIWNDAQIKQWKTITDAVHRRGSFIFCQLWALGRAAGPEVLAKDGYSVVSVPLKNRASFPIPSPKTKSVTGSATTPRQQRTPSRQGLMVSRSMAPTATYVTSSYKAPAITVKTAGAAVLRIVRSSAWKWPRLWQMRLVLVEGLGRLNLAYLHVVEPRISGGTTIEAADEDNTFLLNAFGDKGAIILAGGFTGESAEKAIQAHPGHRVAIAFGRHFLANPDLPFRIARGLGFNQYERPTFYTPKSPVGYIDYPFSEEYSFGACLLLSLYFRVLLNNHSSLGSIMSINGRRHLR